MSTKTFDKQTARFLATVATCMPSLSGEIMQGWINNPKALAGVLRILSPPVAGSIVETKLLKPVAKTTVSARTKPFNAAEFYQTGIGLYVYDAFVTRLDLGVEQTTNSASEHFYVASLLKANAYDTDIRKELPDTHLSTLEDIAGLIEAQPNGKSGFLLSNGYANIFYVKGKNDKVCVVDVRWRADSRRWGVNAWFLDGYGMWGVSMDQVFCSCNAVI